MARKLKPFRTEHTFENYRDAVTFYEQETGKKLPDVCSEFLRLVHDYDDAAVFNVQPGYSTNYITMAHLDDRRPWAFVQSTQIAVPVAHSRNVEALMDLFPGAVTRPGTLTKNTMRDAYLVLERFDPDAAQFAIAIAAAHAAPFTGPDDLAINERFL